MKTTFVSLVLAVTPLFLSTQAHSEDAICPDVHDAVLYRGSLRCQPGSIDTLVYQQVPQGYYKQRVASGLLQLAQTANQMPKVEKAGEKSGASLCLMAGAQRNMVENLKLFVDFISDSSLTVTPEQRRAVNSIDQKTQTNESSTCTSGTGQDLDLISKKALTQDMLEIAETSAGAQLPTDLVPQCTKTDNGSIINGCSPSDVDKIVYLPQEKNFANTFAPKPDRYTSERINAALNEISLTVFLQQDAEKQKTPWSACYVVGKYTAIMDNLSSFLGVIPANRMTINDPARDKKIRDAVIQLKVRTDALKVKCSSAPALSDAETKEIRDELNGIRIEVQTKVLVN